MIEKIIEHSIRNKFFVILVTGVIIAAGIYSVRNIPLDAIPDLSDVQVIVYSEYPGQAPRIVEDQVTYPIASEMLKVPGATAVRAYSFFGVSLVHVIFEDATDIFYQQYDPSRLGSSGILIRHREGSIVEIDDAAAAGLGEAGLLGGEVPAEARQQQGQAADRQQQPREDAGHRARPAVPVRPGPFHAVHR